MWTWINVGYTRNESTTNKLEFSWYEQEPNGGKDLLLTLLLKASLKSWGEVPLSQVTVQSGSGQSQVLYGPKRARIQRALEHLSETQKHTSAEFELQKDASQCLIDYTDSPCDL